VYVCMCQIGCHGKSNSIFFSIAGKKIINYLVIKIIAIRIITVSININTIILYIGA